MRVQRVPLVAMPSAVRFARQVAVHTIRSWELDDLVDTVELLVSELVTNVVQAAGVEEDTPSWQLGEAEVMELVLEYAPVPGQQERSARGTETNAPPAAVLIGVHDRLPGKPEPQYPDRESTTRGHEQEPMLAPYQPRGIHEPEPEQDSGPEQGRPGQEEGPATVRERSRGEHGQREQDGPGDGTPRRQGQPDEQDGSDSFEELGDANTGVGDEVEDSLREHGRGLLLVEQLSEAWGSYPTENGKVVWCRVSAVTAGEAGVVAARTETPPTPAGFPLPRRRPGETGPQAKSAEQGLGGEGLRRVLVGLRGL